MGTEQPNQPQSGHTTSEQNLLTGRAFQAKIFVLRLRHWEVLVARLGLGILATAGLTLLAFTVWRAHRILTIYDREMTYRRISTDWLMRHAMPDRRRGTV
jgi:hypothetical protein